MIKKFSGSLEEIHALERICGVWDYWSYFQLQETFKTHPYQIYYSFKSESEALYFESLAIFLVGEACELLYIYSLPAVRGKGLSKEVLAFAVKDLSQNDMLHEIFLEVRPSNAKAIQLYDACGFKTYGRRPRYYADGEDALLMKFTWLGA